MAIWAKIKPVKKCDWLIIAALQEAHGLDFSSVTTILDAALAPKNFRTHIPWIQTREKKNRLRL
ncbi:hypothetical protein HY024_05360 [Candidatus Curtissbacteria bacterium]|nr:hypothetical protein [Candidatus Curtissbacteria bacterium]